MQIHLLDNRLGWFLTGLLLTGVAGAALGSPPTTVVPSDASGSAQEGRTSLAVHEPDPAEQGGGPGTLVDGGEARFVPLDARPDTPRLPLPRRARSGAEQDEHEAGAGGDPYFLGFAAGEHRPPAGERLDPRLSQVLGAKLDDQRPEDVTYGFVMFQGRISEERTAVLAALGVRILGYHPQNCLRVVLPRDVAGTVSSLEFVRWVGVARPWQKLHPAMERALAQAPEQPLEVYISVFESDLHEGSVRVPFGSAELASPFGIELAPESLVAQAGRWQSNGWQQAALEARGVEIDLYSPRSSSFRARLPRAQLDAVVALDFVQFVEPWIEPTLAHDESMPLVHTDLTRAIWNGGTNSAVVVGEADSGIDASHSGLNHIYGWGWDLASSGTGPWHDGNGHGSHVAGTIFGRADVDRSLDGVAPGLGGSSSLRIFNTKIFNNSGSWGGSTMSDILDRFHSDLTVSGDTTPKPHVINHSWGTAGGPWTGSEVDCRELDTDIWVHGQMHVFAAGNEGSGGSTLRQQPSAKNVFTVGNVLDYQSTSVGFPGTLWTSSSRGPTADLRWKPNVVAPGRWIDSVDANSGVGYTEKSGTSMAAPHVTGLAAQLCDHYSFLRYRASTLGAVMMASALTNGGVTLSAPSTSSSGHHNTYGSGRIEAFKAHNLAGQALFFWNFDMTSSTGYVELDFPVSSGATRLSAVMLYHEIPASAGASTALVNDLDMYLDREPFSSGGNTGNYFAHQSSRDNAETRIINTPPTGGWRIKIYPEDLPPGFLNFVRVGVAVVVTYGNTTPSASLTTSLDKTYVKPNEVVQLTASVSNPSYVASAVYLQGAQTGTLVGAETTLKDGPVANLMNNPWDGSRVLLGNIRQGQSRSVRWKARWATEGQKTWTAYMQSENAGGPNSAKTVIVDGTPPVGPTGIGSSHPVNSSLCSTAVTMTWTAATDNLSGVNGYRVLFDHNPSTVVPATTPNVGAAATSYNSNLTASASPWYFHIRAVDRSGNWGTTQHYGPFTIVAGGTSTYCTTSPNSVGPGATISSVGSVSMSANNFGLVATGLPANQFSVFFFGPSTAFVPFGDGARCVGGTIVRLPVISTQNGTTGFGLDFSGPPAVGPITPGSTWFFQHWYRDSAAGGSGFNLTNGLRATFCE